MIPLGPLFFNPPQGLSIPFVISANGLIEIINYTPFLTLVDFGRNGRVWQEPMSKVIYRTQEDQQGPQTLLLTPFIATSAPVNFSSQQLQQQQNAVQLVMVNVYQEGEIDWYPPVALSPSLTGLNCEQNIHQTITAPGNFSLPITSLDGNPNNGRVWLLGFDLTGNNATAGTSVVLAITNLISGQPLQYRIWCNTTPGVSPLLVRWPGSLPNSPGLNPTFTFTGGFNSLSLDINVYFYSQ